MHHEDEIHSSREVRTAEMAVPTDPGWRQAIIPVAITLAVQSLISMTAVSLPVFMPVAAGELGFSPSYIGLFVTLIYVGATISSPVSGYFIDRFGPIGVSQLCLLLSAAGLAVVSLASIPWMVLGALIIGLGYGPVTPASSYLLSRTTPARIMAMVFSIKQTGVPLGGAMAGAFVPHLVIYFGWRASLWVVGACSLFLMILAWPFRKYYDRNRGKNARLSWSHLFAPLKMVFLHSGLRQIGAASFFYASMQLCLISFLVAYLTADAGMTLILAGIMLSAAQTSGIVGRIIWGALADRYNNPRLVLGVLGVAMAVGAVSTAMFSGGWPHWAVLLGCVVFGAAAIGWNGVYLAEVARLVKAEEVAAATGGSLFVTFSGVLLGLPIFSVIVDSTGSYPAGFVIAGVCSAICGTVLCFSAPSVKKRGKQSRNRETGDQSRPSGP